MRKKRAAGGAAQAPEGRDMINIAIVEDDVGAAEELKQLLADFLSKKECAFEIRHFPTADRFLFDYHHEYDLVFLDIEMPGTNGMDAAREIRKTDQTVSIVFVTNMAHFATAGYSVNASDYILKPINRYEFNMKMVRIFNRLCRSDGQ